MDKDKKTIYLITGNVVVGLLGQQVEGVLADSWQQIQYQQSTTLMYMLLIVPELQGQPEQVAKLKALKAFKQTKKPILVQDTSLCFNAMKGLPGPYIKWFLQKLKPDVKMLEGFQDKTAYAQCIISYMSEELKQPMLFVGRTEGRIVQPRGENNFGWDPIFEPQGLNQTYDYLNRYSQMCKQQKNKISHRYRAILKMLQHFT